MLFYFSEPPSAPRKVKVEDVNKSSCLVSWKAPEFDGGSPIQGYYVERRQGFSDHWLKVNKQPITATQLKVKDLVELSDYEFRVIAENEAGVSKPSESSGVIKAKDPFDRPGKVNDLKVTEVTKDTVTLTWKTPKEDGNSPITNYMIESKVVGEFTWFEVNQKDKVTRTNYQVKGLKQDIEYEFRVTAENKVGQGQPSDSVFSKYGKFLCHFLYCFCCKYT